VDSVVAELTSAGIEPLLCLYGSPSWANGVGASQDEHYVFVPTDEVTFPLWVERYSQFVRSAVRRYRDKVKRWELWNEPNESYFWKPRPSLGRYIEWFQTVEQTIRDEDPTASIALGGLAGLRAAAPNEYSGCDFLRALYARKIFPAVVAIHPYGNADVPPDVEPPYENSFANIRSIREAMVEYRQEDKPIWVTEWGWASNEISESLQARYVSRSLEMMQSHYPYVTLATYFLDVDRPPYSHGLYSRDLRLKEAGLRFRDFMEHRSRPRQ
jgi:hypothetical protein